MSSLASAKHAAWFSLLLSHSSELPFKFIVADCKTPAFETPLERVPLPSSNFAEKICNSANGFQQQSK